MKFRLFILSLFTLSVTSIYSQNISVKSFRILENDMDARINYSKTDQNGEKCAIIKVVTTEQGFVWEGDALGIVKKDFKTSEYWLYIPRGSKRLTIKHSKLGMLRNYIYPVPIKEATVYEMVLTTAKVTTIVEEYEVLTQWVIITSEPEGADVYINDQHKGQTPWQMEMEEGEYNYRLEKSLYHSEAGRFNLIAREGKKQSNFKLKPNFGYAKILTTPESGATVLVDGSQLSKTTPVTTQRLKSGKYTFEVSKAMYHSASREITISDGQTSNVIIDLKPSFGGYTISTIPESGATIMLDGQLTHKTTPCTLERLSSGEHTITVRKEWYEPQSKRITITDGQSGQLEITMKATFGNVKITTDTESSLYIDNQLKGKGSWQGKLIAGWHTFEARKNKHHTATDKQEILVGDDKEINLTPKAKYGSLKIQTTPFDATIKLNGKNYGTTPNTLKDLLIGDYTLRLEKQGYGTISKTITITENQTVSINETLPNGKQVTINSQPQGATLYIEGVSIGSTPYTATLAFGNHTLKLVNGKKTVQQIITISQTGKTSFSFDVSENSFTDTRDGKTYKTVKIGTQTWMAENLNYKTTNSYCYDDNESNCQKYGRLYTWEVAKNACPSGWHLPTDSEWKQLEKFIGMSQTDADDTGFRGTNEGKALKTTSGWNSNGNGTDNYGFSALPGGYRDYVGGFDHIGSNGYWWSATENYTDDAWYRELNYSKSDVSRYFINKVWGFSVRCLRD